MAAFMHFKGDFRQASRTVPNRSFSSCYGRIRNFSLGKLSIKPDSEWLALFLSVSHHQPKWPKADEESLIDLIKTHGRDYDLLAKVLGRPKAKIYDKVRELKTRFNKQTCLTDEEKYLLEAIDSKCLHAKEFDE